MTAAHSVCMMMVQRAVEEHRGFVCVGCILTLHQVLMIDRGQVGEVLLEVRAELSMGVNLYQLLLTA